MHTFRWCFVATALLMVAGCRSKTDVTEVTDVDVGVISEDGAVIDVISQYGPPGGEVEVTVDLPPPPSPSPSIKTFSIKFSIEGEGRIEVVPLREVYEVGSQIVLVASSNEGFYFEAWTGALSGNENPIEVIVDRNLEIGARFVPLPPPLPGRQPPTVDLKINGANGPLNLEVGAAVSLQWISQEADNLIASGEWNGPRPATGQETFGPLAVGVYVFKLTAVNPVGSAMDAVIVTVKEPEPPPSPPPPPPTVVLKVNQSDGPVIIEGTETIHLSWASVNATELIASGEWSGQQSTSGNRVLGPFAAGSHLFVLMAFGAGGTAVDTVTVTVLPSLEIVTVSFSPPEDDDYCYAVGEAVSIIVQTNRNGEVHYLLADSTVVGTLFVEGDVATFTHRFPFPIDPVPPYEGQSFFWPEERDSLPYLKAVITCVR